MSYRTRRARQIFALIASFAGLLTIVCFKTTAAQTPAAQAKEPFKVKTDAVPIDVVAVDKDGNPVLDLKIDDFQILEDGVVQEITYFSEAKRPALTSASAEEPSEAQPAEKTLVPTQLEPAEPRHFLFLMGNIGHDYFKSIGDVAEFVEKLRPQDRVAVMAFERVSAFTNDHGRVAQMLRDYSKVNRRINAILRHRRSHGWLMRMTSSNRLPDSVRRAVESFFEQSGLPSRQLAEPVFHNVELKQLWAAQAHLRGNQLSRALTAEQLWDPRLIPPNQSGLRLFFQSGSDQFLAFDRFDQARLRLITDLPAGVAAEFEDSSQQDFEQLTTATEYMAFLKGEKHLFFFNRRGLLESRGRLDIISRLAADNRVRLHLFQTGGTEAFAESPFVGYLGSPRSDLLANPDGGRLLRFPTQVTRSFSEGNLSLGLALTSLKILAHETGGLASIHSDVAVNMDRALDLVDFKYELAYAPANQDWDGKFRRIEVRVKRPGVQLQHRRGYFALPAPSEETRLRNLALMRTISALKEPRFLEEIPLKLTVSKFKGDKGPDTLDVRIEARLPEAILKAALRPDSAPESAKRAAVSVAYFLMRDGNVSSSLDSLEFTLSPDQYQTALRDGLNLGKTLEAPEDLEGAFLKVVVYDAVNDSVGSVGAPLQ